MARRKPKVPDYEILRAALRKLRPSGARSLEALLCELLSALTERRFFLGAAGSQQGRDFSTGGLAGTWIAVEAKRFRESTDFRQKELLGEILELSLQTPHPDLWTLVASRSIPDQLASTLRQAGLKSGVEVEVLEAPTSRPGDLDFLCASHPGIVVQYISDDLLPVLHRLQARSSSARHLHLLRKRFCTPSLGFDHVKKKVQTWFREALEGPEEARARLGGQPLALLSLAANLVRRKGAEEALAAWWQGWGCNPRPFILLGEEGVGKTWAAAAWAELQAARSTETILLFVPSRDVDTTDPTELIRHFLCEATGRTDTPPRFWKLRIDSWLARSTEVAPVLLLLLDGINERPDHEWRDLFDRLNGLPWRGRVAVLVTCRPGYWTTARFMPEQNPVQLKLEGFDDPELDEALQKSGRIRTEFSSDLLPLVRKPRYLALVIKHYDCLEETGDFTIDRLLYEDWKDRLERKRSLKMTDRQYRTFLGQLAQRYREGRTRFSERDLDHLLPRSAANDLSELLTNGLLSVDHKLAQEYKVEPGWLIHSHGLLLASQLIERGDEAELEETLAQFLEPHLEVD